MKNIKLSNLIIVTGIILLVAIIIVKSVSSNHFRNNAEKWAEMSVDKSNQLTLADLKKLQGNTLIVDLSGNSNISANNATYFPVNAAKILEKENLKKLHNHKGSIVLVSDDPAISARIWMLLSQLGIKNLYILFEV